MAIGRTGQPPGLSPKRDSGIVGTVILWVGGVVGAVFTAAAAMATAIVRSIEQQVNEEYPNAPLTAAEAAVAAVKGAAPYADAEDEARLGGVDAERFAVMVSSAGNPPGPGEVLDMLNRGIIDQTEAELRFRQGYLRNDAIPIMLRARYRILSGFEVIRAAVQGHLADGDARAKWAASGQEPSEYDVAFATAGRPPGIEQMLHLWHRGVVSEADVVQAIRESDVKDKYIPAVMRLGDYLPPPRTVTTLLSHGAIDVGTAHTLFQASGLSPELATAYVNSALHAKTASAKQLTVSQVTKLYSEGVFTRGQALDKLSLVGYDTTAGNLVLDLADAEAEGKLRTQAVSAIRVRFLSQKLTEAQAHAALAAVGIDAAQTDRLLTVWKVEQEAPTKSLTIGQLNSAYKASLITEADFVARAMGIGYDRADAELLAKIDVPPLAT